jgi:hypothetical protein
LRCLALTPALSLSLSPSPSFPLPQGEGGEPKRATRALLYSGRGEVGGNPYFGRGEAEKCSCVFRTSAIHGGRREKCSCVFRTSAIHGGRGSGPCIRNMPFFEMRYLEEWREISGRAISIFPYDPPALKSGSKQGISLVGTAMLTRVMVPFQFACGGPLQFMLTLAKICHCL